MSASRRDTTLQGVTIDGFGKANLGRRGSRHSSDKPEDAAGEPGPGTTTPNTSSKRP